MVVVIATDVTSTDLEVLVVALLSVMRTSLFAPPLQRSIVLLLLLLVEMSLSL